MLYPPLTHVGRTLDPNGESAGGVSNEVGIPAGGVSALPRKSGRAVPSLVPAGQRPPRPPLLPTLRAQYRASVPGREPTYPTSIRTKSLPKTKPALPCFTSKA